MELFRGFSRRSLMYIMIVLGILSLLTDVAFYAAADLADGWLSAAAEAGSPRIRIFVTEAQDALIAVRAWFAPICAGAFALLGLFLWLSIRAAAQPMARAAVKEQKPASKPKQSEQEKKEQALKERRLFLHLIGVLQREGRLLDFLAEDLDEYADEDIGAAVRDIHENCKKSLDKYIQAQPVVDEAEEQDITVPAGFDPNAIKLTGNVTGKPPFHGVVRHPGWQVAKLEMPTLSGKRNPDILAPAEVEIP